MAAHVPNLALEVRVASFRARWRDVRPRPWLVFLIVGIGLASGAAIIGDHRAAEPWLTAASLVAAATMAIGVRIHRPTRPWPWRLIALCTLLTSIGIGIVPATGETQLLGQALAGLGYAAGFGGFILLIRGRMPGGERSAFLDAAILAAGTGVLIWAFGFGPLAVAARQSSIATAAFFYPALIATAVVARMWFLPGAHRPATRMIVLLVISSLGIAILDMVRGFIGQDAFAGPISSPSSPRWPLPERRPSIHRWRSARSAGTWARSGLVRGGWSRSSSRCSYPATLGIEVALGRTIDPAPYLIGGVVIGLLVIARLGDALRQLGDSLRERESLMDLLQHQALYDALTSLPNRNLFNDRLAADFAHQGPGRVLAVLLVDLDDFKAINDSYGHETGDSLLARVRQRLRPAVRDGDAPPD